ncbi:NAD-dependent deacylase [Corynebacterium testudinoris]|uniref:NAD-dependent protein deacylase n=1 Tax=Corynebacterium testudinoris TaxID=136857 RepID=A0A0G3H492_9CORY|nr:NAD-dependent deacylase [Corynebacterium testudinoris]AKK07590.1 NAD-dependent protein deacetylase, SIR2 family [Corynebacterium testudinoris]MBX8996124.1 NAD-dependent deacylase [Corynebacterium testudinoris]
MDAFAQAFDLARSAQRIEIFSGAGMSAESGLDTFRDAQTGLWSQVDPIAMASVDSWERDPEPMWAWYLWRAQRCRAAEPNAGHRAIAEWAEIAEVSVTTQNIDDLHERGGLAEVTHLHGSLFDYHCSHCSRPFDGDVDYPAEPVERLAPPTCVFCGGLIRPGVVWFGEMLPQRAWRDAEERMHAADLVIIVGTSGVVQPAASLPLVAREVGTPLLEISPQDTELTRVADVSWRTTAAFGLPELVTGLQLERGYHDPP